MNWCHFFACKILWFYHKTKNRRWQPNPFISVFAHFFLHSFQVNVLPAPESEEHMFLFREYLTKLNRMEIFRQLSPIHVPTSDTTDIFSTIHVNGNRNNCFPPPTVWKNREREREKKGEQVTKILVNICSVFLDPSGESFTKTAQNYHPFVQFWGKFWYIQAKEMRLSPEFS